MREESGFTLIELLSVIVILAVIALIATPIIIGIVRDTKEKANENSAYGIVDSANYYYASGLLEQREIQFDINILGELTYEGSVPKADSIVGINEQGQVAVALRYDDYCLKKEYGEEYITKVTIKDCVVKLKEPVIVDHSLGGTIKNSGIVTEGSGLYQINDTEYRFRGGCTVPGGNNLFQPACSDEDPVNNYISIEGQKYRVIAVYSDKVKVIAADPLSKFLPFDERTSTSAGPRKNNTNTFCKYSGEYYGCSVFTRPYKNEIKAGGRTGVVYTPSTLHKYLNVTGTDPELLALRKKAIDVGWYMGPILTGSKFEAIEAQERAYQTWEGFKIGLMYVSDYMKASLSEGCQTYGLDDQNFAYVCRNHNWLYRSGDHIPPWTMHPWTDVAGAAKAVWTISYPSGALTSKYAYSNGTVLPVAYLRDSLEVTGGTGTKTDPWVLA